MGIPRFLKPNKKKVIIAVVLVAAVLLGYNFFGRPKQTTFQFTEVKRQDIKSTVSASGVLTGKNIVNLKFKSSGKLELINIKVGDKVTAGQTIASLEAQDLSTTLQQAQNTLRDKQATVDKILDDIHLFQYGNGGFANVGTANETQTQRQLRTTAEVARDNAVDSVKAAQKAFEDTMIISPIDGIVTEAIQVTGQTVSPSDLIARVVDTSGIYFDGDVDEADFSKVEGGMAAEVILDAYPDKIFKGRVVQILPQTKLTSQGANVVTVRIKIESENLQLVNGLSGQVSIITAEVKNALTLPQEVLRDDNTVVLQKDSALKDQKVTTGIRSDTDVEIKEGLNEGERILLNPPALGARLVSSQGSNPLGRVLRFLGGGSPRGEAGRGR